MTAEILSTGDELRTGALVDSNSAWIAEQLEAEGIEVTRHTTVGDDLERLVQVLTEIVGRCDAAVVTGGLGPTTDDLSREAAAEAAGVELVRSEEAMESLEGFFLNRNRAMAPSNLKQALLPESAVCIPNHRGSAPGFHMRIGRCLIFFLPGVPSEMKPMLTESVLPEIRLAAGAVSRFSCIMTFRSFGLNESSAGEKLEGFDQAFPGLKLGYRGFFPEIQIKIYASGPDEGVLHIIGCFAYWSGVHNNRYVNCISTSGSQ
ncbi:MAG: molybdopterin-binding protein [Spirochaetota bacterium]|nr:molybdopterin-binding protein [Spirochaetota bacterium]